MKPEDCRGCEDNFYNGNNPYGIAKCWSFDPKKTLVTKYRLSVDVPMNDRKSYQRVEVPPCHHVERYIQIDKIPDYAD